MSRTDLGKRYKSRSADVASLLLPGDIWAMQYDGENDRDVNAFLYGRGGSCGPSFGVWVKRALIRSPCGEANANAGDYIVVAGEAMAGIWREERFERSFELEDREDE